MSKPKKKNYFEIRLNSAKYKLSNTMKFNRHHQTKYEKEMEIEAAFLIRDIENYGFRFFPDHYVKEKIKVLEKIVSDLG